MSDVEIKLHGPSDAGDFVRIVPMDLPRRTPGWVSFFVPGEPRPQGSKTARVVNGMAVMTELADMKTKKRKSGSLKRWRQSVEDCHRSLESPPQGKYFAISAYFFFQRPPSHYGKQGLNKNGRETQFPGKPDLSHLMRAIEDALTRAGAWQDDARVVHYGDCRKLWCDEDNPKEGAAITLSVI